MSGQSQSRIAAYKSVAAHGMIQEAEPHQLICLLMDGALDRLASARACVTRNDYMQKTALLHRVCEIIQELRDSLNREAGGKIATDLDSLYDYMMRRVLIANLNSDTAAIDEVVTLLRPIRDAWFAIPEADRRVARGS
jgi:flagellar secretion chaperone FliS